MSQPFSENVYVIDLSYVKTPAQIIYDLSTILDSEEAKDKDVCLKLGTIELNQSQLLSIKSLISSINSTLKYVDTKSSSTEKSVVALGMTLLDGNDIKFEPNNQEGIEAVEENQQEEISSTPREYEKLDENWKDDAESENTDAQCNNIDNADNTKNIEVETETEIEESKEDITNEDVQDENEPEKSNISMELNIPSSEAIKEELDTIFNSEQKLEEIFDKKDETPIENEQDDELKKLANQFASNNDNVSTPEIKETLPQIENIEEKDKPIYTEEDMEIISFETKYIKQTVRSGQVIDCNGNIVIIGDCHPGSEIHAKGDITVWGVLGGIAQAGSNGNTKAKIRALKMNAIQLRIADCYARRPDALHTIFAEKTNVFTPEEAKIIDGEIVIFKIND
ncbi:MAG: septum site-determining protein MinC [Candidatus Gastranaerophilales bacterium]|nr:septum site-determining protein MinC [Candidatus Gastranaerophilales bacterium]